MMLLSDGATNACRALSVNVVVSLVYVNFVLSTRILSNHEEQDNWLTETESTEQSCQMCSWHNAYFTEVLHTWLDIYSPNCLQHISNTNICFHKCTFPTLCPKGTQKPSNLQSSPKCWHDISNINIYIQLTYTPQMVGSIYPIQIYIFINVHSQPCARRAHRNPPTYSHPPSAGMIYPISTYIFNWYILPKWLAAYI